ncbi:hypothetical protein EV361DRAFT_983665 [Lentinula raphanica]|uniref:Uncharacterized protein n=1 Tax=Lentinula raphanica TaxID=153919 RepID=A0AA38U3V4_9AGAR|nr:hypothetical protein F5878DRAFT_667108 [Lentinula raphanica]KAJ3963811.1 hypothetical protein EV361DRAFT_983665 [Lentinula raphanica]
MQEAAFSLWAPRLYAEYERNSQIMRNKLPHLPRNFDSGVSAAAAFNLGALGRFDPARTGQLILWELKLVVDFPPAATVLIPSAVITHSNTPIAVGDTRMSFTQYTAGSIFRWVENGCMTEKELQSTDPARYDEMQASKDTAYLRRLGMFSTVEELLQKLD